MRDLNKMLELCQKNGAFEFHFHHWINANSQRELWELKIDGNFPFSEEFFGEDEAIEGISPFDCVEKALEKAKNLAATEGEDWIEN